MDIKESVLGSNQLTQTPIPKNKSKEAPPQKSQQEKQAFDDDFELTPEAKRMQALQEKILDNPIDIDYQKVNALKKAIKNNEYNVDADKLAGNLINLEGNLEKALNRSKS